jgi:NAD(P)-dependent dehydrogenase (short-subunit alcohol dehydrogenase family)
MATEVKTRLAVVTGAAHRLGRDAALSLARMGYAIALHYHNSSDAAESTRREILSLGVRAEMFRADLSDPSQIEKLFRDIDSLGCHLNLLINSAAVMYSERLPAVSAEDFDSEIAVNLRAPLLCSQYAALRMDAGGLIINISDVGASKAWSGYPTYVMSKAGVESLTRLLARSLAPNIRVNAIAPGFVYPSKKLTDSEWEKLLAKVPLRRAARHDEITGVIEFLLKNEYITGQTIVVDGGYSLV